MQGNNFMVSVEEAQEIIRSTVSKSTTTEVIPLEEALGRTLAVLLCDQRLICLRLDNLQWMDMR